MNVVELLKWQWAGYPRYHTNRTNLLLHIVVVPAFEIGAVVVVAAAFELSFSLLIVGSACMLVSMIAQGRGHKLEAAPPEPFTGPGNFIGRLLLEQWINFPRFVLSGKWLENLHHAKD
jgi:hypothetical protein